MCNPVWNFQTGFLRFLGCFGGMSIRLITFDYAKGVIECNLWGREMGLSLQRQNEKAPTPLPLPRAVEGSG